MMMQIPSSFVIIFSMVLPFVVLSSSSSICSDYPEWVDEFGDDCTLYEINVKACSNLGHYLPNFKKVIPANEACCYCGGGEIQIAPRRIEECEDLDGWSAGGWDCIEHNLNGGFHCDNPAVDEHNKTAKEACCICQITEPPTPAPTPSTPAPTLEPIVVTPETTSDLGLVVGVCCGIVVIAVVSFFILWRRKKKRSSRAPISQLDVGTF